MKKINQAFVLAVFTLISANAFAAETKEVPCPPVTGKGANADKAQKTREAQNDEPKKPVTDTGVAK